MIYLNRKILNRREGAQIGERIGEVVISRTQLKDYGGWRFSDEEIEIWAEGHNLQKTGYDRGQMLSHLRDEGYTRVSPCTLVFGNITIDYNGAVMPCCNLMSDCEEHKRYVIEVTKQTNSILDIYFSHQYTVWRRELIRVGPKRPPCSSCKQKIVTSPRKLMSLKEKTEEKLREWGLSVDRES